MAPAKARTARAAVKCPIPLAGLELLERELKRSGTGATTVGWDRCPPKWCTPVPTDRRVVFDVDAVVRVVRVLCALRHTKARWASKPLVPAPWQIVWVIAPTFGFVWADNHPDAQLAGARLKRSLYVEVPRRNGKSTIASGLGIYLVSADREVGAEVYAAATTRTQAGIVLGDAVKMVRASPAARKHLSPYRSEIRKADGSTFRALSRVAEAAHGLNVHGGIVDELHVHRSRDLVDAIETGVGSRRQPLIVTITTADDGTPATIFDEKHNEAVQAAQGIVKIPTLHAVIWAADEDDDPFDEAVWAKANPGLGVSPTLQYMRSEAAKCRANPSRLVVFKRLHLNIRTREAKRFIDLGAWDRSAGMVVESGLAGRRCFGGLDLANTTDIAALAWVFPCADGPWDVLLRAWLPEARLASLAERTAGAAHAWVRDGWLNVTPGNVIDHAAIRAQVESDADVFEVVALGYDRWGMTEMVVTLQGAGLVVSSVSQTITAMSSPTKHVEQLYMSGRLRHGGNPLLRWMASNVVAKTDSSGNVKPDKSTSAEKIDGFVALVIGVGTADTPRANDDVGSAVVF